MNLHSIVFVVSMVDCTAGKRTIEDNGESSKRQRIGPDTTSPDADNGSIEDSDGALRINRLYQEMVQKLEEFVYLQARFNQSMSNSQMSPQNIPTQSNAHSEQRCVNIPELQHQNNFGSQGSPMLQQQFNTAPGNPQQVKFTGTQTASFHSDRQINNPVCSSQRVINLMNPQPSTSYEGRPVNSRLKFLISEDLDNYFNRFKNFVSRIRSKNMFFKFLDECALDEIELKKRASLDYSCLNSIKLGPELKEYFYHKLITSKIKIGLKTITNAPFVERKHMKSRSEIKNDAINFQSSSWSVSEPVNTPDSVLTIENTGDEILDVGTMAMSGRNESGIIENVLKELGATEEEINQFVSLKDAALKNSGRWYNARHIEELFDPVIFYLIRDAIIKLKYDLIYRKYFICESRESNDIPCMIEGVLYIVNRILSDFETLRTQKKYLDEFFSTKNRLYMRNNLYSQIKQLFDRCSGLLDGRMLDTHLVDSVNNLMRLRYTIIQGMCYHLMRIFDVGSPTKKSLYKKGDLPFLLLCTFLDFKKVEEYTLSD